MDIHHPAADGPLSPEQVALLAEIRERLDRRISSHGLTADDVNALVQELRHHPQISAQLMALIRQELARLQPGQSFTFDWD